MPLDEVAIFIDDDGTVTFSDLTAEMAEVASALDPDRAPACPLDPGHQHPRRPVK